MSRVGAPRLVQRVSNWLDVAERDRQSWLSEKARELPPGSRVLDVGAGSGKHRDLFRHCRYVAQDLCAYSGPEMVYGRLDFACDAARLSLRDSAFDAALCTEVLEHVPEPQLVVAEIARTLRVGGKLILTAPLGSGIHMAPFHYFGGFTPFWYEHVFVRCGLRVAELRPNGGFFRNYGQESRRFVSKAVPLTGTAARLALPLKAVLWLWFGLFLPLVCNRLDAIDRDRSFTLSYFVVGVKQATGPDPTRDRLPR